jgi:hypothetical protein
VEVTFDMTADDILHCRRLMRKEAARQGYKEKRSLASLFTFGITDSLRENKIKKALELEGPCAGLGTNILRPNPSYLLVRTDLNRVIVYWKTVENILPADGMIIIYVTKTAGYSIPDRAFATPAGRKEFLDHINELWKDALEAGGATFQVHDDQRD